MVPLKLHEYWNVLICCYNHEKTSTGLAKNLVLEKPEPTFWPTQYYIIVSNKMNMKFS